MEDANATAMELTSQVCNFRRRVLDRRGAP
jgi:hypothetical protein